MMLGQRFFSQGTERVEVDNPSSKKSENFEAAVALTLPITTSCDCTRISWLPLLWWPELQTDLGT